MIRKDILQRENEIREWIKEKETKAFICTQLNCKSTTLDSYLKKMNIVYRGVPGLGFGQIRLSAIEYSRKKSVNTGMLKKKLLEDKIKESKCEICKTVKWMDKPISLHLHHIDGNSNNNNFDNLQILCPNCHSQTHNYCIKKTKKREYKCSICQSKITIYAKKKKCGSCSAKERAKNENRRGKNRKTKINWPSVDELIKMVFKTNYLQTSKKLGVSDNAVRKHIKKYQERELNS